MARVVTPISPELRDLALRLAPPEACTPEALEAAKGQEHLLTDAGFTAHVAHMLGVRCPSPGLADYLLDLALEIDGLLERTSGLVPASELAHLSKYREACRLIAEIAAFQQGLLLSYLRQECVDRPLADRIGVPLEQLDMSIKLLKFGRKNSDGTPWLTGTEWR